jgi:hypothetical protein
MPMPGECVAPLVLIHTAVIDAPLQALYDRIGHKKDKRHKPTAFKFVHLVSFVANSLVVIATERRPLSPIPVEMAASAR